MRTVKLEKEVADVGGFFFELVQAEFEILSVSVHKKCTYINLEDEEEKDPLPLAEAFLEAPAKAPSRSTMEERREIYRKYLDEKPFRMDNLRVRCRVSHEVKAIAQEASGRPWTEAPALLLEEQRPEVLALPPAAKNSWLKKLKDLF